MALPIFPRSQLAASRISYRGNPYLGADETAIVVALVRSVLPQVMIEFGCNTGLTAKTVLDHVPTLETYVGIDVPPDHQPTLACQNSEIPNDAGHYAIDDPRFWRLIRPRGSFDLVPQDLEPCDAAFIDGDHSAEAVRHDSMLARALVRPGGIIIWHDYSNPGVEVTAVLDQLHSDGWPIMQVERSWLAFARITS
jgi:predicted O-methyltransferase YrrM